MAAAWNWAWHGVTGWPAGCHDRLMEHGVSELGRQSFLDRIQSKQRGNLQRPKIVMSTRTDRISTR